MEEEEDPLSSSSPPTFGFERDDVDEMMVNRQKERTPNSNLVVLAAAFSVNLFSSTKFPTTFSPSCSLLLRMRRQKKSFFAHDARPDDSDEEDFEVSFEELKGTNL